MAKWLHTSVFQVLNAAVSVEYSSWKMCFINFSYRRVCVGVEQSICMWIVCMRSCTAERFNRLAIELHRKPPEGITVKRDGNELKYHDSIAQMELLFLMMIDNNNAQKCSPVATRDELKINKFLVKTRWQLSHSNRFIHSNKKNTSHTHIYSYRLL